MRELDDSNWFLRWEEELPSPDELMPLSQTLISPGLAMAFDIQTPDHHHHHPALPAVQAASSLPNSSEMDSADLGSAAAGDEPARTLKRPRLVWTPQLHKRFVDAVAHLGIKNAVPKTIMQMMSVDGLTRENVASHLQKYRLYLKRIQGLSVGGVAAGLDPATDRLFASSPVPAHFLHPTTNRPNSDNFLPFVPAMQHHHHHHHPQPQIAAAAVGGGRPSLQSMYQQMGQFGSGQNGQFEHPFLTRGGGGQNQMQHSSSYIEEIESLSGRAAAAAANGGRKVLTLFPTGN